MSTVDSTRPTVSIIVVPRERFSCAPASLESIYQNTATPFELVYVDGGSPDYLQRYLEQQARAKGFKLIRTPQYLSPNQARNIGMQHANGRYLVFMDNDAIVKPGWLEAMIKCAEETGAGVVGPLYFIGEFADQIVHMAGGVLRLERIGEECRMQEQHLHVNRHYPEVRDQIKRGPFAFMEFHCMMASRDILERVGPFDEGLYSVLEHIDFCLRVTEAGGSVWLEPDAHVSYLAFRTYLASDLNYFRLRWCDDWNERSVQHFAGSWNVTMDSLLFTEMQGWLGKHQRHLQLPSPPQDSNAVATRHRYCAQTNVQLYRQCMDLGYSESELALLRNAYEHAQGWFGDLYRVCGKPFLAHLVGTASILAAQGTPVTLVVAGLLHSLYEFSALGPDITPEKRRDVASAIGTEVEHWLYSYARFDWNNADIPTLERDADLIPLPLAKLLLLRMANDLEEYQDLCIRFSVKPASTAPWLSLFNRIGEHLGVPELAAELTETYRVGSSFVPPEVLRSPQRGSYVLQDGRALPAAHRRRSQTGTAVG